MTKIVLKTRITDRRTVIMMQSSTVDLRNRFVAVMIQKTWSNRQYCGLNKTFYDDLCIFQVLCINFCFQKQEKHYSFLKIFQILTFI